MKDCVGNEIHEGAILKVFHFYGARKRKHFMYKQVGGEFRSKDGTRYLKIFHLPIKNDEGYYIKKDDETLKDSAVVACDCEFHIYNTLKNSKFHGA